MATNMSGAPTPTAYTYTPRRADGAGPAWVLIRGGGAVRLFVISNGAVVARATLYA